VKQNFDQVIGAAGIYFKKTHRIKRVWFFHMTRAAFQEKTYRKSIGVLLNYILHITNYLLPTGVNMPIQKQLSVFLPNRPGIMARTCSILSEAGINILAMAVHDTVDNAVVRFIVDHPTKAILLLEQEELYVMEQDVLVVELDNKTGTLTRICQSLAEADINIAYAYCTATPNQDCGCVVIRTDQPERAQELLNK